MMTEYWRDLIGDGLAVSLELPVATTDRALTTSAAAARLLDAIAVLEDGYQPLVKEDPPSLEFQRLELKIDLLTDLVSSLLADRIPTRVRVSLSGAGVVAPASVLGAGCDRIALYPSQWLAQPLVLGLGTVICRGDLCGAVWRAQDPGFRDALDRWVFRLHRREVARQRMSARAGCGQTTDSVTPSAG